MRENRFCFCILFRLALVLNKDRNKKSSIYRTLIKKYKLISSEASCLACAVISLFNLVYHPYPTCKKHGGNTMVIVYVHLPQIQGISLYNFPGQLLRYNLEIYSGMTMGMNEFLLYIYRIKDLNYPFSFEYLINIYYLLIVNIYLKCVYIVNDKYYSYIYIYKVYILYQYKVCIYHFILKNINIYFMLSLSRFHVGFYTI
jgi:hypothetical protein